MDSPLAKYKKYIWIALAVLILLFAWLIYDSTRFKITGTTPSNTNYPASLGSMQINFSKALDQEDIKNRLDSNQSGIVSANFPGECQSRFQRRACD